MWIKWKYNDHGAGGFKEFEIPEWAMKEYPKQDDCVKNYLCEKDMVPTWGERFSTGRIEWKKISKPSKETVDKAIKDLKDGIKWRKDKLKELQKKY